MGVSRVASLVILATVVWMTIDASKYGSRYGVRGPSMSFGKVKPGDRGHGPGPWFFAGFFLWIVAFPFYLIRRSKPPPEHDVASGTNFCRTCGKPLVAGAKFCASCGSPA